jgi:hypothetical protein
LVVALSKNYTWHQGVAHRPNEKMHVYNSNNVVCPYRSASFILLNDNSLYLKQTTISATSISLLNMSILSPIREKVSTVVYKGKELFMGNLKDLSRRKDEK